MFYSSLLLFFFLSPHANQTRIVPHYILRKMGHSKPVFASALLQQVSLCNHCKICTHVSCCLIEIMRGLYPFTLEMSLFFCPIQSSRIFFTHLEQWICIANYCVITLRKFQRVNKFSSVVQFSVSFFLDLYIKNIRSKLCSVTLQRGTIVLP